MRPRSEPRPAGDLRWATPVTTRHGRARGARIPIVASVHLDRVVRDPSKRQQEFDEEVLLENQILALGCALRLEEFPCRLGPLIPGQEGPDDRLHVHKRFDSVRMPVRPREPQG
jgi:hypothetical protein